MISFLFKEDIYPPTLVKTLDFAIYDLFYDNDTIWSLVSILAIGVLDGAQIIDDKFLCLSITVLFMLYLCLFI
jgi:hypothetical protein